ncbi:MAG TPA: 1-acyl-sn-glycerol-3-phosphate acyltransferase, partial [Acidobacteriaceae bacterium]|nr:1-acyl-sn-glycerol-3-phosphate acyltransferase [Acidobacteriaceae bacterium]
PFKRAQGSIGRPLRGREVQIGPDGEILVRGASIAEQIWQQGRMQQRPEGWLATGDLAARDARGELVFAGRKSDVIVTAAGLNLYPQDLEAALQKQTAVREAIVVPYASSAGPMPVAVLRPQPPPARLDAQAAVGAANRDLAPHQQILYSLVWPAPDFPRTSTGKVLRKQVAAWVQRSLDGEKTDGGETALEKLSPLPADPLLNLLHQLQPETRHRQISREDRLAEDLHLDSLAMVQLQSSLETSFGIELDDAAWQGIKTVGELRRLLNPAEVSSAAPEARPPAAPAPHEISLPEPVPSAAIPVPFAAPLAKPPQEIYPRWPWWSPVRFMRTAFLELILRPLVWLLLAPEVKGQRHLPRPSLIIANHVTALDAAILLYALRPRDRDRVAIAMAGQILGGWRRGKAQKHGAIRLLTPLAYWLVTALFNVFPLPKGAGVRASFAHAGAALDRGYHVLVFPEGGRSPDGRLQPFQSGIGLLAQESEAPVQPVYLAGLGPLKLGQRSWFRPGSVAIRLGEPLEMNEEETPAQFTERLRAALAQLGETE